ATPVTSPLAETVATAGLLLLQLKVCPARVLPAASVATPASCAVPPTARLAVLGVTATVATGAGAVAVTVTAAVPLFPPLLAVMVTEPTVTPVTSPLAETVATAGSLLLQLKVCPARVLPAASVAIPTSCAVSPTARLAVLGVTATVATGAGAAGREVSLRRVASTQPPPPDAKATCPA